MKIVKVQDGDYKIKVQSGGSIILDTGTLTGQVLVTGSLTVLGSTTVVESQTMTIADNIIILNQGEGGAGITLGQAGIQIDRGSQSDALIVFDESVSHYNPALGLTRAGTFVLKNQSGTLIGLRANSISTGGGTLNLIGSGSGVVSVFGTDYEQNILNYSNPLLPPLNDDYLVSTKAMVDYIAAQFASGSAFAGISDLDTTVSVKDQGSLNAPLPSVIEFKVDNSLRGRFTTTSLEIDNVEISGDSISNYSANNLELTSATGEVSVDAVLTLLDQTDPIPLNGAAKLYTKSSVGGGNTGLYYVNTKVDYDGSTVINLQDELISKRRALLFSMIF